MLEAASPGEALRIATLHPAPIDLVVSDVIMPGMSRGDVARRVLATRPGVKVLLISGYAEDALGRKGHATEGFALLPKPFVPRELARAVRAVLDGTGTAGADG